MIYLPVLCSYSQRYLALCALPVFAGEGTSHMALHAKRRKSQGRTFNEEEMHTITNQHRLGVTVLPSVSHGLCVHRSTLSLRFLLLRFIQTLQHSKAGGTAGRPCRHNSIRYTSSHLEREAYILMLSHLSVWTAFFLSIAGDRMLFI